jgi:hypothetical protein
VGIGVVVFQTLSSSTATRIIMSVVAISGVALLLA